MPKTSFRAPLLLVLVSLLGTHEALAGNGALYAIMRTERDAARQSVENQVSIEQNRSEQADPRRERDSDFARGWSRGGRVFMRERQGGSNNEGAVNQAGSGNAASISQNGQGLTASIAQDGSNNAATVRQFGRGSTVNVTQTGSNNTACVIQIGRNVSTDVAQTGGQSTGILQTRRGTREIPVEACQQAAASPLGGFGRWRN